MVQYGMVQYATVQYGMVQYGMVQYGMVYYVVHYVALSSDVMQCRIICKFSYSIHIWYLEVALNNKYNYYHSFSVNG